MKPVRDRGATRSLVLGLLSMWFGVLAPFAVYGAVRSLRRIRAGGGELSGGAAAAAGLIAGLIGLAVIAVGVAWWLLA